MFFFSSSKYDCIENISFGLHPTEIPVKTKTKKEKNLNKKHIQFGLRRTRIPFDCASAAAEGA